MKTLVLFDIDGTLLDTHGAGRASFVRAIRHVFGWDDPIDYIRFAGATDLDILRRVLERHGQSLTPEAVAAFFGHLPVELERTIGGSPLTLYPGVRELLQALEADKRALVGLVTGNIETCARIKLRQFRLDGHFLLGAFGHEHGDRVEIARLAVARAREHAGLDGIGSMFLIGDTPSDVAAAKAIGAESIAVATGGYREDELRAAGGTHVVRNLADTASVISLLKLLPSS